MNYLCIDIGTTCSKAQVFDEKGNILFYQAKECQLKVLDGEKVADVVEIKNVVFELIKSATKEFEINSIAFSSFGESFVLLDKDDEILTYPMLYTDSRGEEQAKKITRYIPLRKIFKITGVMPHSMYSIYKLLYIKENMPEKFAKADKLLLICDYFGYVLTGKRIIDYSLAARSGVFNVSKREFDKTLLSKIGVDVGLFSTPKPTGFVVGDIKDDICKELGLSESCKLVLGSHDQICATIGAGVVEAKEAADGMGTVECITTVFDEPPKNMRFGKYGYPVVPFLDHLYCTYILNLTSNSIMNWYRNDLLHNYSENNLSQFEYLEAKCDKPTDVLVLPYFSGSSTPFQDMSAKGSFVNVTLDTTDGDIYRAIMESTSYEMKYNLEIVKDFGINVDRLVATGGGANSKLWVKIKSDIFSLPIKILRSSEGGLCGLAVISSVAMGQFDSYKKAVEVFVEYKKEFTPTDDFNDIYKSKYEKYKKLYSKLKELF